MKEFYGTVSFSGRIHFQGSATDKDEMENAVYEKIEMIVNSSDESILEIQDVEWDLITEEPRGNVATAYVQDLEIYEEDQ